MTKLSAKYLNEEANAVITTRVNHLTDKFIDRVIFTAQNGSFEDFLQLDNNVSHTMVNRILTKFNEEVPGTKIRYDQTAHTIYVSWYLVDDTDDNPPPPLAGSIW